jgi:hypothetical protein
MELSTAILDHLRYEALAAVCREAIQVRLADLHRQKKAIESTRSPFAFFVRRETRAALDRSLKITEENADVLQSLLAQIQQAETVLRTIIRRGLDEYLEHASLNYKACRQAARLVAEWEHWMRELADPLTAFARELRALQSAVAGPGRPRAIAATRHAAERLAARHHSLAQIAARASAILQEVGGGVQLPELRELHQVSWIQRLTIVPAEQAALEASLVEAEMRKFLAQGIEAACTQARTNRAACDAPADSYLEEYWTQLRTHAREHYVQEIDLAATVQDLTTRYAEATTVAVEGFHDPYALE